MGGMRPDPQQMFNRMDKDGSAGIDKDELSAMTEKMAEASATEIDAVSLVEVYDGDEDGILNQDETHAAMESLKAQLGPPANGGPGQGEDRRHLRKRGLPAYMGRTALKVSPPSTNFWQPCPNRKMKRTQRASSRNGWRPCRAKTMLTTPLTPRHRKGPATCSKAGGRQESHSGCDYIL